MSSSHCSTPQRKTCQQPFPSRSASTQDRTERTEKDQRHTASMAQKFVILLVLLSAAASAQDVVEVKPGEEAVLHCEAGDVSIRVVEWTRDGLKSEEYVLLCRNGRQVTTNQDQSFKDRVQLVDGDLMNGDVSLKLKNVSINDAGTYECRVAAASTRRKRANIDDSPIRSIRLEVKDVVEVKPGEDAVLPCKAGDVSIGAVNWTRPDPKSEEYVLLYRDGRQVTTNQDQSFKDRVQLVDGDLKNGDVSLKLKNVSINDAGTYECRVAAASTRRKRAVLDDRPISRIRLEVKEKRNHTGLFAVLAVSVLVCFTVVGLFVGLKYKRQREKKSEPADDEETNDQLKLTVAEVSERTQHKIPELLSKCNLGKGFLRTHRLTSRVRTASSSRPQQEETDHKTKRREGGGGGEVEGEEKLEEEGDGGELVVCNSSNRSVTALTGPGGAQVLEELRSWRCSGPGGVQLEVFRLEVFWRSSGPGGVQVLRSSVPGGVQVLRSSVPGGVQQEVRPGQDAPLRCRAPRGASIKLLEWSRTDLKERGYVFFYRNQRSYENYQLPSFRGRVELRDPEMKDGDVSVILKNVTAEDAGGYECRVLISTASGEPDDVQL
ncbi:hypothetical protein L3Q82_016436 [Scortum barcoo]|uniref:Uncharacterized protein n=1 Tax=Scortum barcoo TaxID=214431 RepID=A0ACB8X900_9TELE|nr:hypothetical protein L3Q82_016436 [Scortum barcoo]